MTLLNLKLNLKPGRLIHHEFFKPFLSVISKVCAYTPMFTVLIFIGYFRAEMIWPLPYDKAERDRKAKIRWYEDYLLLGRLVKCFSKSEEDAQSITENKVSQIFN